MPLLWYAAVRNDVRALVLGIDPTARPWEERRSVKAPAPECLMIGTTFLLDRGPVCARMPTVVFLSEVEGTHVEKAAEQVVRFGARVATSIQELEAAIRAVWSTPLVHACLAQLERPDARPFALEYVRLLARLPDTRFLVIADVCRLLGTSSSVLHRSLKDSELPSARRISFALRVATALDSAPGARPAEIAHRAGYSCERSMRRALTERGIPLHELRALRSHPSAFAQRVLFKHALAETF